MDQENVLFFINEFATLAGFCDDKWMKRFNAKLQSIAQMGDSENRYLWIASQTGNLAELKMQSSLRSTLGANMLAIVKPGSDAAIAGLTKTDLISNHDEQRMRVMMDRSPVGRAYYYSRTAQWASMPVLPNLSGYDRDTRKWEPGFVPVEPPTEATVFDVAAIDRAIGFKAKEVKHQVESTDAIIEVIEAQPEGDHKLALMAAYKWVQNRQKSGKSIDRNAFAERARKDRQLPYLRDNIDAVWTDLETLIGP